MRTEAETMHIVRLEAENYKRLRAVEITPDGNLVVVSGKNGQGKSSVLDSIWAAIKNAAASKENPDPIRHGETEARVQVHLGDLVVTRTWESGKPSKLTVHGADGRKKKKPQALLDSLVGRLSFDPMAFAGLKPSEQRAQLLDLVELPFNLDEIDSRRADLYAQRTEAGVVARRVEGHLLELPEPPAVVPEKVSVSALVEAHALASKRRARVRELKARTATARATKEQAARTLAAARETYEAASQSVVDAINAEAKIPADLGEEPSAIQARIDSAETVNAAHDTAVRDAARRAQVEREAEAAREHYQELHAAIDLIDAEKAAGLKAALFPVEGLSFDDAGVLYNDVPFSQCCASERLRVSVAMAIELNPVVRVIRLTDGSLLDSESMAALEEMAIEHDMQVWVEVVSDGGETGVVIEDGQVV